MYKLHLILKYLRKRRIAWVSLLAVMLCTAMVLVVISVMGGWLRMFRAQFHGLVGDIIVQGDSLTGFPHYQEMIDRIEALPDVRAAVPTIQSFALINIQNQLRRGVQVVGYPIERIGLVNEFPGSLYRQHGQYLEAAEADDVSRQERATLLREAEEAKRRASFALPLPPDAYRALMPKAQSDPAQWPGMIVGAGVVGIRKDREGNIVRPPFLMRTWVRLTTVAVDPEAPSPDFATGKSELNFWIVDDSRTKIFEADQRSVYVDFTLLQQQLRMNEQVAERVDTGEKEIIPARTSEIHIGVREGAGLQAVKADVKKIVDEIVQQRGITSNYPILVETWEESQAIFLNAIEKEVVLVTILFSIISLVAVFLIFCIFYMIVVEKTKDIGIIKSVGATSGGVAGIFLGYGLAIGIVGAGLGFVASYFIVRNINYLHTKMGQLMGIEIWNPEVYAFDTIPDTMDPRTVVIILLVAVLSSVIGSMLPALRAARMNPVEALRWE